ncbi:hypothetical protein LCGC14_0142910 [marine sediment metagenome]|uniref:Uncharacterized protein n=1 Tax=marine sediment metagenome TaxID=412755 RepID=A0A0F9XIL4_9ZZZZ
MNLTQLNELEELKTRLDKRITHHRESLASSCRALIQHLQDVACKLGNPDISHLHLHISNLGEIQSSGTIIDAECGQLMGKIEVLGLLEELS